MLSKRLTTKVNIMNCGSFGGSFLLESTWGKYRYFDNYVGGAR
jgi:hypothetical protein